MSVQAISQIWLMQATSAVRSSGGTAARKTARAIDRHFDPDVVEAGGVEAGGLVAGVEPLVVGAHEDEGPGEVARDDAGAGAEAEPHPGGSRGEAPSRSRMPAVRIRP